ncbi:MAG: hypothetical protein JSW50_03220, partial [Candidatus Latescibacterota bacterium]
MNKPKQHNDGPERPTRESPTYWRIVWQRFKRDKLAVTALALIVLMFAVSYLAPVIANNKPIMMRWEERTYFPAVVELFPLNHLVDYGSLRAVDYSELREDDTIRRLM